MDDTLEKRFLELINENSKLTQQEIVLVIFKVIESTIVTDSKVPNVTMEVTKETKITLMIKEDEVDIE